MSKYKLWTNVQNHPAAKAFMSTLKLQNHRWTWTSNSAEATLWCICAEGADLNRVGAYYDILSKKPPVAFLAAEFSSMPYPEWVYFRVPLNVNVLHTWLVSKNLGAPKASDITKDARWYTDSFKLTYWPNVSVYVGGGSAVMMLCSRLLYGWCSYDELQDFDIDKNTLDLILADAIHEGNLVYRSSSSVEHSTQVIKPDSWYSSAFGGFFKHIALKFA